MPRDTALYIKSLIQEAGLDKGKDNFDCASFCDRLEMEPEKVIRALIVLFVKEHNEKWKLREEVSQLIRENDRLDRILDDVFHGNGRLKQMAEVSKGLPIAKKKNKNLIGVKVMLRMGASDMDIMKEYNISRTTLWRWKKEIAEEQKNFNNYIKQSEELFKK